MLTVAYETRGRRFPVQTGPSGHPAACAKAYAAAKRHADGAIVTLVDGNGRRWLADSWPVRPAQ